MKLSITTGFALAIILACFSSGHCQSENLVYNGGFEKPSADSIADGWRTKAFRKTTVDIALDREIKHSGSASCRFQFQGKGGRAMLFPEKDITPVTSGQTYEVSLWVKAKNIGLSPNYIVPSLQFNFSPKRISPYPVIDLMAEIQNEGEWEQLALTGTAPPGSEKLSFKIILTKGTIWIDDISIKTVSHE